VAAAAAVVVTRYVPDVRKGPNVEKSPGGEEPTRSTTEDYRRGAGHRRPRFASTSKQEEKAMLRGLSAAAINHMDMCSAALGSWTWAHHVNYHPFWMTPAAYDYSSPIRSNYASYPMTWERQKRTNLGCGYREPFPQTRAVGPLSTSHRHGQDHPDMAAAMS
jgi:hypothetical protein